MRRGFTILELCLVLAVILIVAAITVPSLDGYYDHVRLEGAADIVRSRWAGARVRAVEDGMAYRFSITPQTGQYRIEPDLTGEMAEPMDGDVRPLIINDVLAGDVVFADADAVADESSSDMMPVAVFLPDGTARNNVQLVLRRSGGRGLVLQMRALTGAVQVRFEEGR